MAEEVFSANDRHGPERITTGRRVQGVAVTVHCYRVGTLLFDAGPPCQSQAIADHLDGQVSHVLVTHHHPDHVGAARALHDAGATVWAHEDALYPLWNPPEVSQETQTRWGPKPDRVDAEIIDGDLTLDDRRIEVLPTPGHSQDHLAFHLPDEGWVFTGDVYIGPRVALAPSEDLDLLLDSYQRICELDPERMFPAHGAVVKDPRRTLTKVIEHFQDLRQQAWELEDDGLDRQAITETLFEARTGRFTRGTFTHANLVDELLAHR